MKRIDPCKVLAKYGPDAYKVDLPRDMSISPIFNMKDLIKYKGPNVIEEYSTNMDDDVEELGVPIPTKPQAERILDSRVKKRTRNKTYMEHLVKWENPPESKANWIAEGDFKNH